MRKFAIAAALAASTLMAAAPAAAQWYPPQPQGHAYGYQHNYGQVRRLDARIDQLQRRIHHLDRRNILSDREAARLRWQSNELERRLRYAARNGLTPWEARDIEQRIYRLETRIHRQASDFNRYGHGNRYYGGYDRDRDGFDDRYERNRGRDYDDDRDDD